MIDLLPDAVDAAAERQPDRDAVRFGGSALSYATLSTRASRLARVLNEHGVRRGDRVAILANKGFEAAVAMYGIMKAGAAYVPIDPSAPLQRAALIIRDCGIRHLVTQPSKMESIESLLSGSFGQGDPDSSPVALDAVVGVDSSSTIGVGVSWAEVDSAPPLAKDLALTGDDLSYVLYTSGSTGIPKGVTHSHRSALAFARVAARTYGFEPSDRLTNHAPLHFDLSTLDYFAAAVAGATTVVIPEIYTKVPASLSKLLESESLTVLYAVPLALAHLVLYGALEQRDLSALRWVLFGGEPFPPKHLRSLMMHLPHARFSNVYGPTEVNGVTYWPIPPIAEGSQEPIPIGVPYEGVELDIVNVEGTSVPPGDTGELWVNSPTMMQGYWGREDLDTQAFAERTDADGTRVRYHRTGDLVRLDEHGVLHFLGRRDRQIKTRGYRVELDEVEAAMTGCPAIETAAVYGVPDGDSSTAIEASVVLRDEGETVASLLRHAALTLPPYALPEHVEILEALPRTSTDKIDRVTLRARAIARRAASEREGHS